MAETDRPVSRPFVRAPSDVAHDRIKGPYTAEDAVTPGDAIGDSSEDDNRDAGLTSMVEGDPGAQKTEEAVANEARRRAEDMSATELDEAEARDRLAASLQDEDERQDPEETIPAVGSPADAEDKNDGPGTVNDVAAGSELATEVSLAKQENADTNAEPVLEADIEKMHEEGHASDATLEQAREAVAKAEEVRNEATSAPERDADLAVSSESGEEDPVAPESSEDAAAGVPDSSASEDASADPKDEE